MLRQIGKGALFFILAFSFSAVTAFAEGDTSCPGRMVGTATGSNPNVGDLYFNAHPDSQREGETLDGLTVDLGIEDGFSDGEEGYAPQYRETAACITDTAPAETDTDLKTYRVEGWAYSDNVGFISFYCGAAGQNPEEDIPGGVTPFACNQAPGNPEYGVTIGPVVGGERTVSGYAWNDALGYIKFSDNTFGATTYDLKIDAATGDVLGGGDQWVWAEGAEMWVDFSDIQFELPGEVVAPPVTSYCSDYEARPICVEVSPHPRTTVKAADGKENYQIDVYLRDNTGAALDLNTNDVVLTFVWEDTVKTNQLLGLAADFSDQTTDPTDLGVPGAVRFKPIDFDTTDAGSDFQYFSDLGSGHYQLDATHTLRALAPTSGENYSTTTSTDPALKVSNEKFIYDLGLTDVSPNNLKLKRVDLELNSVPQLPLYANGSPDLGIGFKPAYEFTTLYASDLKDSIEGVRSVPVNYTLLLESNGNPNVSGFNADFELDYSPTETSRLGCVEPNSSSFLFYFLRDLEGADISVNEDSSLSTLDLSGWTSAAKIAYLASGSLNLQSIATLDVGAGVCTLIGGPSLYTKVYYTADDTGADVYYYSNKLPRLTTAVTNPSVVVHGNIYAPKAFSPNANQSIQETGHVETSSFKNAVYENIVENLSDVAALNLNLNPRSGGASLGTCTITDFGNLPGSGCADAAVVGGETVVYVDDYDVVLDLAGEIAGSVALVVTKGNVFVDSDITSSTDDFAMAVMGPSSAGCSDKGNIYIGTDVRNIDANMYSDCSLMSYGGSGGSGTFDSEGVYSWGSIENRVTSLNSQLVLNGSIASYNTIGGADSDVDGFLRTGFGEVIELPATIGERLRAQAYDLNFLRLFTLEVQKNPQGLPIDQKCGKGLNVDDIIAIQEWQTGGSFGESPVTGDNGEGCNGIDPNAQYNSSTGLGDLVAPTDASLLAEFTDAADNTYDPVYVFYRPATSFLFGK